MQKTSVCKEIKFPDIPGYQALKCDFHMHIIKEALFDKRTHNNLNGNIDA